MEPTATTETDRNDALPKSSCSDLQSRLKVRKVLGVGGETSGSTCSSKISQILGQSDHYVFQLPPKLATWLIIITIFFSLFTLMGFLCPSFLRLFLPGSLESTLHLATSYAFLSTILALTLRSGDKICLQLVLFSLVCFHGLSLFIVLWLMKTSETHLKCLLALILHCTCLIINTHFYRLMSSNSPTSLFRLNKFKSYLNCLMNFSNSTSTNNNVETPCRIAQENSLHID